MSTGPVDAFDPSPHTPDFGDWAPWAVTDTCAIVPIKDDKPHENIP